MSAEEYLANSNYRKRLFGDDLQRLFLEQDSAYHFMQELTKLDTIPLEEKRRTLIYVDYRQLKIHFNVLCYEIPFLVPALSGIAMIDGMPFDCVAGGFGFEYYSTKHTHPGMDKVYTQKQLCTMVKEKGFSNLIIYNPLKRVFEKVRCL
jgi:hypothetical protein